MPVVEQKGLGSIKKGTDGAFYFSGLLDESTNLKTLLDTQGILKLNFKDLRGINSLGVRNLMSTLNKWFPRPVEYYECQLSFVDAINIMPQLLGTPPEAKCIKSLYAPYKCEKCVETVEILLPLSNVKVVDEEVRVPNQVCPKCHSEIEFDSDMEDYLMFLYAP